MPRPRFHPAPLALAVALAIATWGISAAHAQSSAASPADATFNISLAAQPLGTALNELARQAKLQPVVHPDLVAGKSAPSVSGNLTARQPIERMLAGSGLLAAADGSVVVIKAASTVSESMLPAIVVTARSELETETDPVNGYVARLNTTGMKTDTPTREIPQSVSVVTRDSLDACGASSLAEALEYVPGFSGLTYGHDQRYDWSVARGNGETYGTNFRDGMREAGSMHAVPRQMKRGAKTSPLSLR